MSSRPLPAERALRMVDHGLAQPGAQVVGLAGVGVEPELKREAAAVLKASGLDVSTAIRLFLRSVVEKGGLPMELSRPNPTTLAAIKAAKANKVSGVSLEDL